MTRSIHVACCRMLVSLLLAASPIALAQAQSYPTKSIRLVVPYPAGGVLDVRARQYAQQLALHLKQPIVIDNRPGASGIIATELVAKAAPDGYTLLVGATSTLAINPALSSNLPYDVQRDFVPIALLARAPMLLVVRPSLGVRDFAGLLAVAKASPGQLTYASGGNGTPLHLAGEMLKTIGQVDIVHVAYKGDAPALADLLAGHVDFSFQFGNVVAPHLAAKKLHAVMITAAQRASAFADVPSAREVGAPELELAAWSGIVAPRGVPSDIVRVLNAALRDAMHAPEIERSYIESGGEVMAGTPEEFAMFLRSEAAKWQRIVKLAGATLD